jgi:hypothetical protein
MLRLLNARFAPSTSNADEGQALDDMKPPLNETVDADFLN